MNLWKKGIHKMKEHVLKIVSLVLTVGMCISLVPTAAFADDDIPSPWAEAGVKEAIAVGIVPQTMQSQYTKAATRAEFAALAVTLFEKVTGSEITERQTFSDTTDVHVEKAAAIGIVSGLGANRFAPDDPLTREQAAVMLSRIALAVEKPLVVEAARFSDSQDISPWALESVGQMQASGIMNGVGDNRFEPESDYTKEQSIMTALRLYKVVHEEPALIGVSLSYISLYNTERYGFHISEHYESMWFSSEYFYADRIVKITSSIVPDIVLAEIAGIARTSGDLGLPDRSPPAPTYPPGVQVSTPFRNTWESVLKWDDGTETGMGDAKDLIMQYLIELSEQFVDKALQEGSLEAASITIRDKWVCPQCGLDDNFYEQCRSCHSIKPEKR